jgi:hypothetical protein
MTFSELCWWGLLAHIVADLFLQNDWMSDNKTSLKHRAAWIHSGIHYLCFLPLFGPLWSLIIFVTHILIDTREPLKWWRKVYKMKSYDPNKESGDIWNVIATQVAFWQDQMAHIAIIILCAYVRTQT